jgi:FkbM family methyltransferase
VPAEAHSLPLSVRAALRLAPNKPALLERVARRTLRADRVYEGAAGFRMKIDPGDPFQRAMLFGTFDPWLEDAIARFIRPGDVVFDCGTYIGFVTLRLARQVGPGGQVHAFEADPRVVTRVEQNLAANEMGQVRLNHAAVSDADGELELRLTDQLGWATVQEVWDAADGSARVPAVRLDTYVEREGIDPSRISFIKLDVEGAEPAALRGADSILRAGSPAVLVEVIPWRLELGGTSDAELFAFMAERGYAHRHVAPEDVLFTKEPAS